jgi:hypothetical protein
MAGGLAHILRPQLELDAPELLEIPPSGTSSAAPRAWRDWHASATGARSYFDRGYVAGDFLPR